jgi:uncharacterized protein YndB with AHSA1/START domain
MSAHIQASSTGNYELEIAIDAPRARVWKALIAETNVWWLPDFHMVAEGSTVTLHAEAGGMLAERFETGACLLWYTVHAVVPESSISLVGQTFPRWGGPTTSMLHLELEDRDGGCVLRVADALVGRVTESQIDSLRDGWTQLFSEGLKRHAEAPLTA